MIEYFYVLNIHIEQLSHYCEFRVVTADLIQVDLAF